MSAGLYAGVGFLHEENITISARPATDGSPRVHVDIDRLSLLLNNTTTRNLRDALNDLNLDLGDA